MHGLRESTLSPEVVNQGLDSFSFAAPGWDIYFSFWCLVGRIERFSIWCLLFWFLVGRRLIAIGLATPMPSSDRPRAG